MNKQGKVELVKKLEDKLKTAKTIFLVNFAGLSVSSQQTLKSRLKEVGSDMVVVKNTLLKRAGNEAKLPQELLGEEVLQGQTALVLTEEDPIAPIQIMGKFVKEFSVPQFKVGVVEGNFQNKASLEKLSTLPSKEVLLSQVLGGLMSPMYGLVGTLSGNMQKLIYILKTKAGGDN